MSKEALKLALEALEGVEALLSSMGLTHLIIYGDAEKAITNLSQALAEQPAQQQEPVAWIPIEQMYPQAKAIDILMGDGSILCTVLPQFDGDLWWEGSGTGEKFIDPKYANVTHWRIHDERTSPPASKPWVGLTDDELADLWFKQSLDWMEFARVIEVKLKEKNT